MGATYAHAAVNFAGSPYVENFDSPAIAPTATQGFAIASGAGSNEGGDVPLPLWALALLGAGLLGAGPRAATAAIRG